MKAIFRILGTAAAVAATGAAIVIMEIGRASCRERV